MKIVIVDPDYVHCQHLKGVLERSVKGVSKVLIAETIKEGYELIKRDAISVVFINLNLCNKTSFKLLRKYKERNFEVVFMMDGSLNATEIFGENGLNYITKPAAVEMVRQTLNKVRVKITSEIFEGSPISSSSRRISLKEKDGIRFIEIDQIKRCASDNNYTEIYLENGERILSSKTLKEYTKVLEPFGFYRVHQSHLVDIERIDKIVSKGGLFVKLKSNDLVELSRRRKEELLKRLNHLDY